METKPNIVRCFLLPAILADVYSKQFKNTIRPLVFQTDRCEDDRNNEVVKCCMKPLPL